MAIDASIHGSIWRARWAFQFVKRGQFPKFKAPFWFNTELGLFKFPDIYGPMCFEWRWEKHVRKLVSALRDGVFLDVGANFGLFSVIAARNGNKVISIEANPDVFLCLQETIRANKLQDMITAINAAAWNKPGEVIISKDQDSCLSHVKENDKIHPTVKQIIGFDKVNAITLDSLNSEITLAKIDIEGSEPMALAGAKYLIKQKTPIIFEAWNEANLKLCMEFLQDYRITKLDKMNYYATS